ncbi:hypothetical protein CQJ94_16615 [Glycomyces fuscus]|nr:hypothetical protein CQJ94_16615 [Glycomyces fuscus]
MPDRTKTRQCAPVMICPDCTEEARNIAPTAWALAWNRPDYSHRDGTELCPDYGTSPDSEKGRRPLQPVVFVPLEALTPV